MARKRYSKGKRVDMRQGGRVNLKKGGGSPQPKRHKDPSKKEPFKQSQVSPTPNVGQPPPPSSPPPPISTATEDTVKVYKGGPKGGPGGTPRGPRGPGGVGTGGPKGTQTQTQQREVGDQMTDPETGEILIWDGTGWVPQDDYDPDPDPDPDEGSTNTDTGFVYTNGAWVRPSDISATAVWNVATQSWEEPAATATTTTATTPSSEMARLLAEEAAKGGGPQDKAIIADPEKVGGYQVDAEGNPILDPETGEKIPIVPDMKKTAFDALTDEQKAKAATAAGLLPKGFSFTPPADLDSRMFKGMPQRPPKGKRWAYGPDGQRIAVSIETISGEDVTTGTAADDVTTEAYDASTYDAATIAGQTPEVTAALKDLTGGLDPNAKATVDEIVTLTEKYTHDGMPPDEALEKAKAESPLYTQSPESVAQFLPRLEEITADFVPGPVAETREGQTIGDVELQRLSKIAEGRGVPLEDLPEYKLARERSAQTGEAQTRDYVNTMGMPPDAAEATATFYGADYTPEGGDTNIDNVPTFTKASERTAQVGEAATKIAADLGNVPSVDLEGRTAITGTAPQGDAAQIGGVPTMAAATMEAVTGQDRSVAAEDMLSVVGLVPPEVTAAIAEDAATVEAQIDSGENPQVTAAVAALPEEALVSVQMGKLLEGMEEGTTPAWARPAVAQVEQMMAERGLSVSTVGRDALFNAIIQTALPMAQSNAQALQQRAQQNLSNEQQANLSQAQHTMTVRMQNLANRQTSASQTASMAQQIKVQQGQFTSEAVLTTAQQQQQARMTDAQFAQQKAQQESQQRQQAAIASFDANSRRDLAELQHLNMAAKETMTADQQMRLTKYNAQIAKVMRQADLEQEMEKANLSGSLQFEMQNLTEKNAAAKDTMTVENQERLTNIQTLIDFRKTDAQFAQQMDIANMTNEQQMELAMLQDKAATDTANFTADNQFRLTELNAIVQRNIRQAELDQRMEEVNLDSELKVELAELSERNTTSRANMTADQQTRLANLNVLVDFRKTNAAMAQQMDLANLGNEQQMELANLQERAATDAANFTEDNRFRMQELNNTVSVLSQNQQLLQQADLANLSMQEKISLANLTSKNQADSESMSAENVAELARYDKQMNAAQFNANLAKEMGLAQLSNDQQSTMLNAQISANIDMAKFSTAEKIEMSNSKFMQTTTLQNMSEKHQGAMQNAAAMASLDLATVDQRTKLAITNAQNFLAYDMSNLDKQQQASVMEAQMQQQALLSDQAATNASLQFNAKSENETNLFMTNLAAQIDLNNAARKDTMETFNATQENAAEARRVGIEADINKFNSQLTTQVSEFNANQDFARNQWLAQNGATVEASNTLWRRNVNVANTAAQNTVNFQNAQNAFNLSQTASSFLWQEMRDQADYDFRESENDKNRIANLVNTAIASDPTKYASTASLTTLISTILDDITT